MLNLGFGSVMGRVTSSVWVKIGCFHFRCPFGYGFGLFGSDFGSRVYFAKSNHNIDDKKKSWEKLTFQGEFSYTLPIENG